MKIKSVATSENVTIFDENQTIASILDDISCSEPRDEPFYLLDMDDLVLKFRNWNEKLPRVQPFYAVKCNDNHHVLKTLATLGTGFDCASEGEMQKVLNLNVEPNRIINAQPTKMLSHLKFAAKHGIEKMTFDCESELHKIKKLFPAAKCVLRIRYDDETAQSVFGKKFGCDPTTEAGRLLQLAAELNLTVIGTSFHVGSGSKNPKIFYEAIKVCSLLFETAKQFGFEFKLLDIGGGYPGNKNSSLDTIAHYVNAAIDDFFSDPSIQVIAEPGRYFVASAFTLATNIHSMKLVSRSKTDTCMMYYVNDGVFGSLNCVINDHVPVHPLIFTHKDAETQNSTIWGPTCDGLDAICENIQLPKLDFGDWIFWENLGAYSLTIACNFNSFPSANVHPYVSRKNWRMLNTAHPTTTADRKDRGH